MIQMQLLKIFDVSIVASEPLPPPTSTQVLSALEYRDVKITRNSYREHNCIKNKAD